MSDENKTSTPEYLLLMRNYNWDTDLSPDEIQQAMDKFTNWYDNLKQQGKIKEARPLNRGGGKIVTGKDARVADGPFAESKEEVGGFFLLDVATLDEAVEIARACPVMNHGCTIEVREVAEECVSMKRHREQMAKASA